MKSTTNFIPSKEKYFSISYMLNYKKPILLIPFFASLSSMSLFEVLGANIRPLDILYCFAAMIFFLQISDRVCVRTLLLICLVIFGFLYSSSVFFIVGGTAGFLDVIRFWLVLSWTFLAYSLLRKDKYFSTLVNVLIISAFIMSMYQVFIYLTNPDVHRIGGYYGYAGGDGLGRQASYNEVGAYLAMGISAAWSRIYHGFSRYFGLIGLAVIFAGLLLTGSRSSTLAAIFAIMICHFSGVRLLGKIRFKKIIGNVFGLFCISIGLFTIFYNKSLHLFSRISNLLDTGTNAGASVYIRLVGWYKAYEFFLSDPLGVLFGLGKGFHLRSNLPHTLENFWLDVLFSYGLVGLVIVGFLLIFPFLCLYRQSGVSHHDWFCQKAFLLIILVVSLTGNVVVDPMLLSTYVVLSYTLLAKYKKVI